MNISKTVSLPLLFTALLVCSCTKSGNQLADPAVNYSINRTSEGALSQVEIGQIETEVLVKAKDSEKRTLTIEGSDKSMTTIQVSSAVKRFDEIKVGDIIRVLVAGALAFEVRPPTAEELANPTEVSLAAVKNPNDLPPGMVVGATYKTIVTIIKIDTTSNNVTFKKADGREFTVKARYPENIARVKVGDTVAVSYSEAAVIEIK